jgi:RsmE family RNA methyltransferase
LNLLLFQAEDFSAPQRARVSGRRLTHLREVLRPAPGDVLRAGQLDGALGTATLLHLDAERAEFAVHLDSPPPPPSPVTLVLALPRPRVLRRALRAATLLGTKEIHLIHSWRVDKSYWQTPLLAPQRLREELLLALELARDTMLPRVLIHRRFKPFIEDELDAIAGTRRRLLAHPGAGDGTDGARGQPLILALGPEGGFIPYEVECFRQLDFTPVSLGDRILSVEVALTAALAVLTRT